MIRCNKIEHWVHLRCTGIHIAQYTDTWTCHLHKESRLTTHTDITPPFYTLAQAITTPRQHRHTSNTNPVPTGLVKPKPNTLIHSFPHCPELNTYTLNQILSPPHHTHPYHVRCARHIYLNHVYHPRTHAPNSTYTVYLTYQFHPVSITTK